MKPLENLSSRQRQGTPWLFADWLLSRDCGRKPAERAMDGARVSREARTRESHFRQHIQCIGKVRVSGEINDGGHLHAWRCGRPEGARV